MSGVGKRKERKSKSSITLPSPRLDWVSPVLATYYSYKEGGEGTSKVKPFDTGEIYAVRMRLRIDGVDLSVTASGDFASKALSTDRGQ